MHTMNGTLNTTDLILHVHAFTQSFPDLCAVLKLYCNKQKARITSFESVDADKSPADKNPADKIPAR